MSLNSNYVHWSPGVSLADIQKEVILSCLRYFRNNKAATARSLKISVRNLEYKIVKYKEEEETRALKNQEKAEQREQQLRRERGNVDQLNAVANKSSNLPNV